jgi:hypothetical protein
VSDFDIEWDFTVDHRYGRHRSGCGCQAILMGIFVAIFGTLALVAWVLHHRRQIELVVFFGLVVTAAYLGRGYITPLFASRAVKQDADAPPTPLQDVKPGFVHTMGLVGGVAAPILHDPLRGTPCVFFRVVVEPFDQPGKILFESRSSDALALDDGSGCRVTVPLEGARWLVERQHEIISSVLAPEEHVAKYFAERGLAFPDTVRVRVTWIAPHELVFVRGVARASATAAEAGYRTSEARTPMEITATATHPVLVALEAIPSKRERAPAAEPV